MATKLKQVPADYEADFFLWSETQAEALRARRVDDLDWDNLAEEIESLGRRDRRELRSRLTILVAHLLKWRYQARKRSKSWRTTIATQRLEIKLVLDDSPSLRAQAPTLLAESYKAAREQAARETGLSGSRFPDPCPFTVAEVLDTGFLTD